MALVPTVLLGVSVRHVQKLNPGGAYFLLQFLLPIYTSCGHDYKLLSGRSLGSVPDPRCTATPAPPAMPIFVTTLSLDLISATLFIFAALGFFRRIAQLLRSIFGLVFFMLIHLYSQENNISSPVSPLPQKCTKLYILTVHLDGRTRRVGWCCNLHYFVFWAGIASCRNRCHFPWN